MRASAWSPLLEGDDARRANDAVEAVAASLTQESAGAGPGAHTLAAGKPGLALLFGYLARARPGGGHEAREAGLRRECLELLAGVRMDASLWQGFCGILWVLDHLDGDRRPSGRVDRALRDHLATSPWPRAYDLLSGLAGCGVYALERLPDPVAVECLECVVDRLAELAEHGEEGACWFTPPALLPEAERAGAPGGYWNLGVGHGTAGAAAVVAAAAGAGVAADRSRPLAEGAVAWQLAQRLPAGGGSRFAYWLAPGAEPVPARSAWCYGDPGIAAALLLAARAAEMPGWEDEAVELALLAAGRPDDKTGVVDAGLCHGAAGLGHIFNRLHQATGRPELADAARRWLRRVLAMRDPAAGPGGFAGDGLLTGAAGAALALLAATSEVEPAWDRLLLLSGRP